MRLSACFRRTEAEICASRNPDCRNMMYIVIGSSGPDGPCVSPVSRFQVFLTQPTFVSSFSCASFSRDAFPDPPRSRPCRCSVAPEPTPHSRSVAPVGSVAPRWTTRTEHRATGPTAARRFTASSTVSAGEAPSRTTRLSGILASSCIGVACGARRAWPGELNAMGHATPYTTLAVPFPSLLGRVHRPLLVLRPGTSQRAALSATLCV